MYGLGSSGASFSTAFDFDGDGNITNLDYAASFRGLSRSDTCGSFNLVTAADGEKSETGKLVETAKKRLPQTW